MATKESPVVRAEPEIEAKTVPTVVPYQSVIRMAHRRALDRE